MGKERSEGEVSRVLFVKFRDIEAKQEIMKRKSVLYKNKTLGLSKVYCNDDLPEEVRLKRQEMREIARYAVSIGYENTKVRGDKLNFGGKTYLENELHLLPKELKMENIRTRRFRDKIGFLSKYSYLSNFFPAQVVINGLQFDSSEHAYQYTKAVICERDDVAKSIRDCTEAKKAKKFGDKLDTTDDWEGVKVEMMRCILTAKFMQNRDLKRKLCETKDSHLMECSTNMFWGTGWKLDSPKWTKSHRYPGKNILGMLLMEVRESISSALSQTHQAHLSDSLLQPGDGHFDVQPTLITAPPSMNMFVHNQMGSHNSLNSTSAGESTTSLPSAAAG